MGKKKVLIVDDERDIVEALKYCLEGDSIECMEAYDGEAALAMAKREKPDLILLDVMLPKIHGYKVARLLKFDAEYKHIPILMLTARAQEKDITLGKEVGVNEYITKPFDMELLTETVKRYLQVA